MIKEVPVLDAGPSTSKARPRQTRTIQPIKVLLPKDATKFNECLSPQLFMLLHQVFFDQAVRKELDLPQPTTMEQLFFQICKYAFFILAIKRVKLGNAPVF